MNFPRQRVNSSTVASIGYDPATAILEVEFVNGSIYDTTTSLLLFSNSFEPHPRKAAM